MTTLAGVDTSTRLTIDWRAYFRDFIEEHGEPIRLDGRLLFRDGWGYSVADHQGPEFRPPSDRGQLRSLQQLYWTRLLGKLIGEQTAVRNRIKTLADWDTARSLPLQVRRSYQTEEGGGLVRKLSKPENLDLSGYESNLADLDYLVAEAREELEALS